LLAFLDDGLGASPCAGGQHVTTTHYQLYGVELTG